jgi:hypothetical protein
MQVKRKTKKSFEKFTLANGKCRYSAVVMTGSGFPWEQASAPELKVKI